MHALPQNSLAALTQAAAAVNSSLDPHAVLGTIASLAREVTHAEAANLFLLNRRKRSFVVVAAVGQLREILLGREFAADRGVPGLVLRSGLPVDLANARACPSFDRDVDAASVSVPRGMIAVPLTRGTDVLGVVQVINRVDGCPFSRDDVTILQLFATLAAIAVRNAQAFDSLRARFDALRDVVNRDTPQIVGESAALRSTLALCDRVAPSTSTVLIQGETGTGKELIAQYIHHKSRRNDGAFIAVNCAALPETLLESELFGHEKGSFTGAHQRRAGWFEAAGGGTLFLDEIGEISKSTQAKLLRVLQEREVVRIGGTTPVPCDVRVIAATNRDLKQMVAQESLREDLFYRLSVFPIVVPALRERPDDIPVLVRHFVRQSCTDAGREPVEVPDETMNILRGYAWPGNIRELQNAVERAVLMSEDGVMSPDALPRNICEPPQREAEPPPGDKLHEIERAAIVRALQENEWNISQSARALGISRDKLRSRVEKLGIRRPQTESSTPAGQTVVTGPPAG